MSRGLIADACAYPKPSSARLPGRKFSMRTSALSMSCLSAAAPSGVFKSMATLFLLRLSARKKLPSPPMYGAHARVSSPCCGSSIFSTSAPMSPSIIVQKGPATTRVRSMTRSPCSGAMSGDYSRRRERGRPALRPLDCDRPNSRHREFGDVSRGRLDVFRRRLEHETETLGHPILADVDDRLRQE